MDLIKKHVDTVVVLGGILASVFWMNARFNEVNERFSVIDKEITVIKTVMLLKGIMPSELAAAHPQEKEKGG